MDDLISRQAAIDALEREKTYSTAYKDGYTQTDYFKQYNMGLTDGIKALNKLPSVQPEPLTDQEQRIFLAAMGREEKVCKQIDDECRDCREAYEDSLVKTCHEIIRKVKGALWMT